MTDDTASKTKSTRKSPTNIEHLVERGLVVSLPAACILAILVFLEVIEPSIALMSFASILMLTLILMVPFMLDLQAMTEYTDKLLQGEKPDEIPEISANDEEAYRVISAINQMHNIWSQKQEALEAQKISDAAVMDSLPDPLIMLNKKGIIIGANLSARDMLGHNIRDKHITRAINEEKLISAVNKVIEGQTEGENVTFALPKPWQKELGARVKALPSASPESAVAVISLHDLTEIKKVERLQSDFVANASHELKTPLSVIIGFIETIKGPAKDDEKARENFLNIMLEQANRMTSLVNDLLSLSKIEMGNNGKFEPINIGFIADSIQKNLASKAEKFGKKISVDKKTSELIDGNESEIKQVVLNIIDNAIKYSAENSEIKVEVKPVISIPENIKNNFTGEGKYICFSTQNIGNVIAPEHINRLTERFYRVENELGKKVGGTGLGLAIVKQIVIKHKGILNVTSNEENGTIFSVYLPAQKTEKFQKPPVG